MFKQCYDLIKQKKHLTQEGLKKIVALKCNLNKGLTEVLMEAFPNIVPVPRPRYNFDGIPNPYWISGFVSGAAKQQHFVYLSKKVLKIK